MVFMRSIWKAALGSLLSLTCFAAGVYLSVRFERLNPTSRGGGARDLIYLPTPQQARLMSLGYTSVVADFYWVKALQYFTDPTQRLNQYKNLADYLEVVLGVDPDYEYAYKFAGIAVPHDTGRFRFVNTKRSTSFLERGVKRFPENWQLRFFLGYNYLNFHNEPIKAAEQFAIASELPGAPTYFAGFAARLWTVGGEVDRALDFARGVLKTTKDAEIRELMEQRVRDLEVERELRRIEAAAKAFEEKTGHLPANLDELVGSGFTAPLSGFSLDDKGVAHSDLPAERMRIYEDPNQAGFSGE